MSFIFYFKSTRLLSYMMATGQAWKSFLCLFAQEHPDLRLQELLSLASIAKCPLKFNPSSYSNQSPFLIIQLQSEECARKIMSRALLIKSMFELWGWGCSYKELESSILNEFPAEQMEPYTRNDYTFKVIASSFSKKCSTERQKDIFTKLSFLSLGGKVNLKNHTHEFHLLEDYGHSPNMAPANPLRIFFGRLIAHGQRHLIRQYSVKERMFIGNTSMDAQLSLIMANQGKVEPGSLVYDPFAGTGSLLVACAHFGGHVMGSDIDKTLLHGRGYSSRAGSKQYRGQGESVVANLRQYGLESLYVDMLVADAAKCIWREGEIFDAILTDPPYGIRESSRRIGSRQESPSPIAPEYDEGHIPAVRSYRMCEVFTDLLQFAAHFLVIGGRLVYWIPGLRAEFSPDFLPTHPCMKLIACCEQPLQRSVSRWLVTMEKYKPAAGGSASSKTLSEEHERGISEMNLYDNFRQKYFKGT